MTICQEEIEKTFLQRKIMKNLMTLQFGESDAASGYY
jgi:hypothetical protein